MPPCRARPAFYASHRVRPARRLLLRKEQGGHSSSRRHDERAHSRLKRLVPRLAAALISRRCRARRRARRAARPRRSRRSRRSRMQGELLCRSRDRSTCAARRARCSPTRISRDIAAARQPGYAYECLHLRRAGKVARRYNSGGCLRARLRGPGLDATGDPPPQMPPLCALLPHEPAFSEQQQQQRQQRSPRRSNIAQLTSFVTDSWL